MFVIFISIIIIIFAFFMILIFTRWFLVKRKKPIFNQQSIFKRMDINKLGDNPIEQAIKTYNHIIVAFHIGTLDNGNKYALLIGTSDEWVNVITYNKAKQPVYQDHGFSIKENRWSYGSKIIGAPQLRETIKNNFTEIKAIMKTQETVRKEKEKKHKLWEVEAEKASRENERKERKEQALFVRSQKTRQPIIEKHFIGLEFEYNANKKNHEYAKKDCENSCYAVDLKNQTCSCDDYLRKKSQYKLNDIRRLCRHLNEVIIDRKLLKKNKDSLKNFVLQNIKGNPLGIYFDKLDNEKPYAIVAYSWTRALFVATPKTNKDGFLMVYWRHENDEWTANKGGRIHNSQIGAKITDFFNSEKGTA